MGLSRSGPDAAKILVCANGSRVRERGTETQVEVAADPAEQRGLHFSLGHSFVPLVFGCLRVAHSFLSTSKPMVSLLLLV